MAKLIMACCAVIVGITLATFWMQVQTGSVIADMHGSANQNEEEG